MSVISGTSQSGLPPLTMKTLGRIVAIGAGGLVAWELFARFLAPPWIGFALDPTGLIEMAVGLTGLPAQALHLLTGLVIYPVGYLFVVRPLMRHLAPGLSWSVSGLGYGVALWVFALYGMASLLGGAPVFLGFEPIAWASLVGHLVLGLAMAATNEFLPWSNS